MRTIGWLFSQRSVNLSVTIALVTALVLMQPSHMWAQVPTPQSLGTGAAADQAAPSIPKILQCKPSPQPLNAIDMNTVSFNSKVKTVHVEKEFFDCIAFFPPGTTMPVIVMVSIYNELFEDVSLGTIVKSNSVETCVKELNGTVIGCQIAPPSRVLPTITQCQTQPLAFPVRMNTVVATGPSTSPNVAETVEAEKEVFMCNPNPTSGMPTTIEDVVIFTKILEDMNSGKTLSAKFVVVTCAKDIATTTVACK